MGVISELQETVGSLVDRVGPSVVRIGRGWGRGAGVVIADGLVMTNAHNLRGSETTVTFADGRTATGSVKGSDGDGDLAALAVDTGGTPPVAWEPGSVAPAVGTPVFAVANPAGRGLRVTFGLVSAVGQAFPGPRGRAISGSIEHTAPLNRGSSGGPIVAGDGTLVGINTHRLGDGFYLAIPADAALKGRIDALARGEAPRALRLGVALAPSHAARRMRAAVGLPERDGLLVRGVQEGGPAAAAGVRQGDLLVAAAGTPLAVPEDLHRTLDGLQPGGTLALALVRGTEDLEVTVVFAEEG